MITGLAVSSAVLVEPAAYGRKPAWRITVEFRANDNGDGTIQQLPHILEASQELYEAAKLALAALIHYDESADFAWHDTQIAALETAIQKVEAK